MIKNETKLRVRYGETDQMGYVYYGNYAQFFEVGRVEWLRNLGISYKSLEESNIMLPTARIDTQRLLEPLGDGTIGIKCFGVSVPRDKQILARQ